MRSSATNARTSVAKNGLVVLVVGVIRQGGVMRLDCATPRPAKPREAQLAWWCWLNKVRRLR